MYIDEHAARHMYVCTCMYMWWKARMYITCPRLFRCLNFDKGPKPQIMKFENQGQMV